MQKQKKARKKARDRQTKPDSIAKKSAKPGNHAWVHVGYLLKKVNLIISKCNVRWEKTHHYHACPLLGEYLDQPVC